MFWCAPPSVYFQAAFVTKASKHCVGNKLSCLAAAIDSNLSF